MSKKAKFLFYTHSFSSDFLAHQVVTTDKVCVNGIPEINWWNCHFSRLTYIKILSFSIFEAGILTSVQRDFKNNLLTTRKTVNVNYTKNQSSWINSTLIPALWTIEPWPNFVSICYHHYTSYLKTIKFQRKRLAKLFQVTGDFFQLRLTKLLRKKTFFFCTRFELVVAWLYEIEISWDSSLHPSSIETYSTFQ